MTTTLKINWDDIKDIQVESSDTTSTKSVVKSTMNKEVCTDRSMWINRNTCEKVTMMYALNNNTTLFRDKTKSITHWFGNGTTICLKARRNVYNNRGNFTFTDADLEADMAAVYSYDGSTKKGTWYICDMQEVRTSKMYKKDNYWICPEKQIISHAALAIEVNFK